MEWEVWLRGGGFSTKDNAGVVGIGGSAFAALFVVCLCVWYCILMFIFMSGNVL